MESLTMISQKQDWPPSRPGSRRGHGVPINSGWLLFSAARHTGDMALVKLVIGWASRFLVAPDHYMCL